MFGGKENNAYLCSVVKKKRIFVMCQTALISKDIVRLGTRSYRHRMEALAPNEYHVSSLRKLNRDLDSFYAFLSAQCNSVTEADYEVFGGQLSSLVDTLYQLYQTCKRLPKECKIDIEAEKLKSNYSALYELNEDIKNFKVRIPKDPEWQSLLSQAGLAIKSVAL